MIAVRVIAVRIDAPPVIVIRAIVDQRTVAQAIRAIKALQAALMVERRVVPMVAIQAGPDGRGPGMEERLKQSDPELYEVMKKDHELENHAFDLARKYRDASKDDQEKIKKEIEDTVNQHFDVRQQRRKMQLDRAEKELDRLRKEISRRNDERATIVKNRIDELLGEHKDPF